MWWHGRKVARRLAEDGVTEGGPADVTRADGTPAVGRRRAPGPPDPGGRHGGGPPVDRRGGPAHPVTRRPPEADLAPDQLAAVDHAGGPARVIAPAGSGKTRVLTERLRLLVRRGTYPGAVTALAYNTRAAESCGPARRRPGARRPPRAHPQQPGPVGVQPPSGRRAPCACSTNRPCATSSANCSTSSARPIPTPRRPTWRRCPLVRLGPGVPDAAEEAYPDATGVAEGFDRFRAVLAERGQVDFDEQIYRAVEILAADPAARAKAQARCRRMLVDEFQDLTPAHLLLIRLLVAPGFDCFGVGDDDQVIYGYSGATPEFLIDFGRYFPGAADHPLEVNYRCPPAVVDAARHLLSYNRERVDKTIRSPGGRTDRSPLVSGPLAGRGPVVVERAPTDALADRAVEVIDAWRAPESTPPTSPCWPGSTRRCCPSRWRALSRACRARRRSTRRAGPHRHPHRLRLPAHRLATPDAIRREDVRDTVRRPSRGIAPMVVDMLTKQRTTSIADIRRLASRLSGRDVPKLAGLCGRPRGGGGRRGALDGRRTARPSGWGSASTPPSTPSTPRGRVPTAPPTPTTWPRWSRWHLPSGRRHVRPLAREVLSRPPAAGPAWSCRPSTGSRERSGATSWSSGPRPDCSPIG